MKYFQLKVYCPLHHENSESENIQQQVEEGLTGLVVPKVHLLTGHRCTVSYPLQYNAIRCNIFRYIDWCQAKYYILNQPYKYRAWDGAWWIKRNYIVLYFLSSAFIDSNIGAVSNPIFDKIIYTDLNSITNHFIGSIVQYFWPNLPQVQN